MKSPRDLTDRCLDLFRQGQFAAASRIAHDSVQAFPDDGELWQLYGLLRQREGDFGGACAALETASLLVPLAPVAQCALADCHARAGRRDLARDLYLSLIGNQACPTALLPAVASGLGCVGDDAAALDACSELARRVPARHEAYFGMAYYMRRIGYETSAILPVVTRASELAPESAVYRVLTASLLAQLGNFEAACDRLRDVRPDTIRCVGCLRRIMAILDRGGAVDALSAFRAHIAWNAGTTPEETC